MREADHLAACRVLVGDGGFDFCRLTALAADEFAAGAPNGDVVFGPYTGAFYFATNGYQQAPGAVFKLALDGMPSLLHQFAGLPLPATTPRARRGRWWCRAGG